MNTLTKETGVFNMPSEGHTLTLESTTTATGFRSHALTTTNREFAFTLFEQALEFDNEPNFRGKRGVYFVQFIAGDDECATVLRVARGGDA